MVNIHIQQDGIHGLHTDEAELFSLSKIMYADYWQNEKDGQPVLKTLDGDYWKINYRINRLWNTTENKPGKPNINKEFYFKTTDGNEIRVQDQVSSDEGGINWALEKNREIIEKTAYLASLYEDHQRYEGDINRLLEATMDIDIMLHKKEGHTRTESMMVRDAIEQIHPELEATTRIKIVEWSITNPEIESEAISKLERRMTQELNIKLPLQPTDSGQIKTEIMDHIIENEIVVTPDGHKIKFGDPEPKRTL